MTSGHMRNEIMHTITYETEMKNVSRELYPKIPSLSPNKAAQKLSLQDETVNRSEKSCSKVS